MPARFRTVKRILLGAALLAGLLAVGIPQAASARAANPEPSEFFTEQEIERSRRYHGPRYVLGFSSLAVGLAAAAVLGLGRPTRWLGDWATRASGGRWIVATLILAGIVSVVPSLVTLPFAIARGWAHEHRFGLSTQSLAGFLADWAKANAFQIVLTAGAAIGFFAIVRKLPSAWPFAAAAFMVSLTVALVVVYPLVYEPLFNKFKPVDGATRDRIVALAGKAGVEVDRVLEADASRRTTKLNAYVSGLGATKRVVLYDTLLEGAPEPEVDLIVAHELGHVVHRDVLKGTLLGAAGAIAMVGLVWLLMSFEPVRRMTGASGAGDPRALPFLVFVLAVATLVTMPVANSFSRAIEADADRFAIALTDDTRTAIAVEQRLARENVADLNPNGFVVWMFFTHPPVMERIRIAQDAA